MQLIENALENGVSSILLHHRVADFGKTIVLVFMLT